MSEPLTAEEVEALSEERARLLHSMYEWYIPEYQVRIDEIAKLIADELTREAQDLGLEY